MPDHLFFVSWGKFDSRRPDGGADLRGPDFDAASNREADALEMERL